MAWIDKMPLGVRQKHYAKIVLPIFESRNIHPSWTMAFALVESAFKANAINKTGGDGMRGGAYGLYQMTLLTAQGLGYTSSNPIFLLDPVVNADYASKLIAQLRGRFGYDNLEDIASAYNSGRPLSKAPHSTRDNYVPKILTAATKYGWSQ